MRPLLIFLGLALPVFSSAQNTNADSLFFAKMPLREVTYIDKPHQVNITLPFKAVHVWDASADMTSIGFIGFKNIEKPYRVVFKNGLSGEIGRFVTANYLLNHEDNAHNLILLVKKFRVSDYANIAGINNNNSTNWNSGVILSAELFLESENNYHALYKVDTTVVAETESVDDLIEIAFKVIFAKSENKQLTQMHIGKTAFTYSAMKNHSAELTDIPILKDEVFKKGVYANFNEFKTNNPSIKDFEVKKGKLSDELIVTDNNQSYPLQDFWGYCDGEHFFLQSANNLFRLFKTGNTFNTKAIKSLSRTYEKTAMTNAASTYLLGAGISSLIKNKYVAKPIAFQLDMETGKIY